MSNEHNILLMTDSYKTSHYKQYPPGTQKVYSYLEARKNAEFNKTVFFGLQYYILKYLVGKVITREKIDIASRIIDIHMGPNVFNKSGWERLLAKHDGTLPIEIKAVPEVTLVDTNNVLLTVENTDTEFPWLTSYLETLLLKIWYPCTVATLSYNIRRSIEIFNQQTSDSNDLVFKLHDFGYRGASSEESAGIGGLAHLLSFNGTDTLAAILTGINYYGAGVCAHSIPASEHSTITSWGISRECEAYQNILTQYPNGTIACVSDSYDLKVAVEQFWGRDLKSQVLARNGTLVIRPDSGDPIESVLFTLRALSKAFGTSVNSKGYHVLNSKVRVIQGDGCNLNSIIKILTAMMENKFAVDNIAFGMGGALLQKLTRDTQSFAFKCSNITVNNIDKTVFKKPALDPNKASKAGKFSLIKENGFFKTVPQSNHVDDWLKPVFYNGEFLAETNFQQIKARLHKEA